MPDTPLHGDVLITAEDGRYLLSVVPNPHRLSLSEFSTALQIARRMADANKCQRLAGFQWCSPECPSISLKSGASASRALTRTRVRDALPGVVFELESLDGAVDDLALGSGT